MSGLLKKRPSKLNKKLPAKIANLFYLAYFLITTPLGI